MKKAPYNQFPAFIPAHIAKEILDGEREPEDLYKYHSHLEKIEIHSMGGLRYLIAVSKYFKYNLIAFELILESNGRYMRCKEIADIHLFECEDLQDRFKRQLMHKMLDAFLDGEIYKH